MDFVKGQLVRSKAGRDKTRTLAVLAVEEQMLLLADGDLRKLDNPKRKKKETRSVKRRSMSPPRPPFLRTSF